MWLLDWGSKTWLSCVIGPVCVVGEMWLGVMGSVCRVYVCVYWEENRHG